MALPASTLPSAALLAALFLVSGWLTARTIAGEAVVARLRGQPPPRILLWYAGVHKRAAWFLLGGAALAGAGFALAWQGREQAGLGGILAGVAVALYAAQAAWVVAAVRRALAR